MKKLYSLFYILTSGLVFSQTILNESESSSRTVQDPDAVVLAQGFHATSSVSNPFVAKIGTSTETPPDNPTNSNAGSGNPSGTSAPQGSSFHDTQGNIEVNGGGQLQFTLPIALPPGVKSVAPQINLVYTSGSGNGIAGYGWNISGITAISRVGRTIEKDGETKGIQLDYTDYYSFNGQRLILKSGEYGKNGAEYVTEKFSNIKIKSIGAISGQQWQGPEYWEVTFEDGSQAWYGAIATGASTARTPVEYNIVKWKDAQGNYITYNYTQADNVAVISTIQWGGNETLGKTHFNEIEFNYNVTTLRLLPEQSYVNGVSLIQDKLLNNIVVKTNNSQYKKYDVIYKSDNTKYQFVGKIQEYNSENQPANPIEFYWQENQSNSGYVTDGTWSSFNTLALGGDFYGAHVSSFIVKKNADTPNPAGYYLGSEYYLGTEDVYNGAIPINIKDANNFVSSRQGFVSYSINSTTKDITLSYYLIDLTKPISYTAGTFQFPNALYLVGTKIIPRNEWDESEHTQTNNPYYQHDKTTTIKRLLQYDIDSDGVPEVLIEKNNHIVDIWCSNQVLESNSQKNLPPDGDCETYIYDEHKYIVIKQQDNSFPFFQFDLDKSENLLFGDFNGDGIDDIGKSYPSTSTTINGESVPGNILKAYNLKKNVQGNFGLSEIFSANYSGLSSQVQIGDFNGDGISDLFVRTNINNHYIVNLNTGKNFIKIPYFNDFNSTESYTGSQNGNYSTAKVLDINADGKSDIINFSSNYNIASSSANSSFTIKVSESQGYLNGKIQFVSNQVVTNNYNIPFIHREVLGLRQNSLHIYRPTSNQSGGINSYNHYSNLQRSSINKIVEGGIETNIYYNSTTVVVNYYKPIKNEQYPLMELARVNSNIVSQISENGNQGGRNKYFRYRGLMINLHNKKTIGFRQMASSSWSSYNLVDTKIWSGIETDPWNEGVSVKEWSIRTNDESQIFPADISENNTQLLSFKSTEYRFDKRLNGALVDINTVPLSDKAKVVSATVPIKSVSKDFMKDVRTESTIQYDNTYYLPTATTTNINNGFAISTTNLTYIHNPSGTGKDYYIGRPASKNKQMQVYSDTKNAKEEYSYENNLLKTLKTYNRDNSGGFQEQYSYDGFGNITEKKSTKFYVGFGPISPDEKIVTAAQYDSKGRFVIQKTDNLGLVTNITYNDWGQVLTQTDPLGVVLTNEYDGWGKILKSKTNLSGYTTYEYKKESNGDAVITEYSADGDQKISYTNKYGQNYINKAKKFGQGQYVSVKVNYDALGRKIGESEPYTGDTPPLWPNNITYDTDVKVEGWNLIKYNDNVYPADIKVISFNDKRVKTSVLGRTTTIKELNGYERTTSKTTDAIGNIITSNDKGGTITFTYNAAGENTEANYEGNIVKNTYDAWGNKTKFEDPSNGVYEYQYNGFMGAISKTKSPKGEKTYEYNNKGQLIRQKEKTTSGNATDKTINFTYNSKGLITGKSGTSLGKAYSSGITYDSYGRVLSASEDSNGKYFLKKGITYDDKMRVTSYEKQLYSSGILTKVSIENEYDTWSGELYRVKEKGTGKILWQLNEVNDKGQVKKARLGGVNIENWYLSNGLLDYIDHKSANTGNTVLYVDYNFDAIKNELKSRITGGDFSITEFFDYDSNNRLVNWTDPVTGIKPSGDRNVYDNKGRITQNDQVGTFTFGNTQKKYQPTGMVLNDAGKDNYLNDLLQKISYNENNDPVFIDGLKGDVAFEYGLTSMRQKATYGGNFEEGSEGKFTKYYSEDGSYEVIRNNQTGQEKHLIYIGGTPYEANIVYLKNYTESSGSFKFLHKDYLGSILAITDEAGNKLEQRHFDAWGNVTHLKIGNNAIVTDKTQIRDYLSNGNLIVDRGYTSHEHFAEVGLIHMNGRLYDPLLRRFLNADENIQEPTNTQNYNKYGYVMNNPMMYNDPSGEFWGWLIGALVGSYFSGVQANNGNWNPVKWDWKNTWTSVVGGAFAGAAIGGGIQSIGVNGTKFIENSVVGAVGGIFNGLATGQNIFKSALIGFSGVNYSIDIFGNKITSTSLSKNRDKYIISSDFNDEDSGLYDPNHIEGSTFQIYDRDNDYIGIMNVQKYRATSGGLEIYLRFKAISKKYSNYNFVQTIRTNSSADNLFDSKDSYYKFNDPTGSAKDDNSPYYYTKEEYNLMSNRGPYTLDFADSPSRSFRTYKQYWRAELSLVGIRNNQAYEITTLWYGFDKSWFNINLMNLETRKATKLYNWLK